MGVVLFAAKQKQLGLRGTDSPAWKLSSRQRGTAMHFNVCVWTFCSGYFSVEVLS